MNLDPVLPPLSQHNLRSGTFLPIPRPAPQHPLQGPVAHALLKAVGSDHVFDVAGTPYGLFARVSSKNPGNAAFGVTAAMPLGGGEVAEGTIVYSGSVACHLPTAPSAWRHIFGYYLRQILEAPSKSFNGPGLMPRQMPWHCGFTTVRAGPLAKGEWSSLWAVVWLAGCILLERCERACEEAAMAGTLPNLDPDKYAELRDWAA